jgi:RNA polymerase sigma factor (sigma-70 family)
MAAYSKELKSTRYTLLRRLEKWDDHQSWKDFFEIYGWFIRRLAIKSGLGQAEAEDVVQETLLSVAQQIHKFRHDRAFGSFRGWLHRITRRRIADQFRRRAPERTPKGDLENPLHFEVSEIPDRDEALEALWETEWKANLFEAAMARVKRRIKEEQYQLFTCYVVKGWPALKVARMFRVSLAKVYVNKHRVAALIAREIRELEKSPIEVNGI